MSGLSIFAWSLLFMFGNTTAESKFKTQIQATFVIANVTLEDLSDGDQTTLKSDFQTNFATEYLAKDKDMVAVGLRMGRMKKCGFGLIVQVDIDVADDEEAARVIGQLAEEEMVAAIKASVKTSSILKTAIEAKSMTVDHLGDCTPETEAASVMVVATTKPVTVDMESTTTTAAPTTKATTKKAAAAVASFAPFAAAPAVLAMGASTIALCV